MRKILIGALIALYSFASFGATLYPLSLMNPAGSTAGQVPLSTGPSTAPAWGSIGFANLPQVAANTVLGNGTASTAAVTALTVPSCSAAGNALKWTSASGFTCGTGNALTANPLSQFAATTSAQLAGVISDETGSGALVFSTGAAINPTSTGATTAGTGAFTTISATGLITPTSTVGIKGTATNDSAQAGSVGEFPTPTNLTGVSLTVFVVANTSSVSLTAGNWIVQCGTAFAPTGSTVVQSLTVGISPTSATLGAAGTFTVAPGNPTVGSGSPVIWSPLVDIKLASTTTEFCVASANFSASTMTAGGFIRAWRLR